MGGHSKPMLFDRELVELHLKEIFWRDRAAKETKSRIFEEAKSRLEKAIELSLAKKNPVHTEMKGRGGRQKIDTAGAAA